MQDSVRVAGWKGGGLMQFYTKKKTITRRLPQYAHSYGPRVGLLGRLPSSKSTLLSSCITEACYKVVFTGQLSHKPCFAAHSPGFFYVLHRSSHSPPLSSIASNSARYLTLKAIRRMAGRKLMF